MSIDVLTRQTFCRKCGRSLTDPDSIRAGIGPVCGKKRTPGPNEVDTGGSVFRVLSIDLETGIMVLEDVGLKDRRPLHAAMDDVVRNMGGDRLAVVYRDTMGKWDVWFQGKYYPGGLARDKITALSIAHDLAEGKTPAVWITDHERGRVTLDRVPTLPRKGN